MKQIEDAALRPKALHRLQDEKMKRGEEVIPSLGCLAHLLEIVGEQPKTLGKETIKSYVLEQKEKYSVIYESMQKTLAISIPEEYRKNIFPILDKLKDAQINFSYKSKVDKFKKDKSEYHSSTLIDTLGLYTAKDMHYLHIVELGNLYNNFALACVKNLSEEK